VKHFLQKFKSESKGKVKYVSPETMGLLMRYHWPGNERVSWGLNMFRAKEKLWLDPFCTYKVSNCNIDVAFTNLL